MVIYLLSLMSSNELKPLARVVELVDSLASGASARKGVRVRLPPRAPMRMVIQYLKMLYHHSLFYCCKQMVDAVSMT